MTQMQKLENQKVKAIDLLRQYRDNIAARQDAQQFPGHYSLEQLHWINQSIIIAESIVQHITPYRLRQAARLYYMDSNVNQTWEAVAELVQYCSGGDALRKQVHRSIKKSKIIK